METSSPEEIRRFYDETAGHYARMMDSEIELALYEDTLGRLAERIAEVPGALLDTSCGPGHMLARYRERFDAGRTLIGVDLSPEMVALATERLGPEAEIVVGDMRDLERQDPETAAAAISFFAIHHLDPEEVPATLAEWRRVLVPGGQLVLAAWEGSGVIDYGDEADVVAHRYRRDELRGWAESAGFLVDRCVREPVEGFPMDAVYLEGETR